MLDFVDNGTEDSSERARFLTLHGGSSWNKSTKTNGDRCLTETRLNVCANTQPSNLCSFARNNQLDGLFSRFLVSVPKDVFYMSQQIEKAARKIPTLINMEQLLKLVCCQCLKKTERNLALHVVEKSNLAHLVPDMNARGGFNSRRR